MQILTTLQCGDVVKLHEMIGIVVTHLPDGVQVCVVHDEFKPRYRCDLPLGWIVALHIGVGAEDRVHCVPKTWRGDRFVPVARVPDSVRDQILLHVDAEARIRAFEDQGSRRNNLPRLTAGTVNSPTIS